MRALAAIGALLALTVPAAAAVPVPRSVTAPAPVTALAADGDLVAFATGRTATDCDRIRIWNRRTGRLVARLGRTTHCEETSTGSGIAALSLAGRRVLWLHYTGGNIREWSLFTATTKAPKPRRIAFFARDVDEPPPVVIGQGYFGRYGYALPYAIGAEVRVIGESGRREATWTETAPVTALDAEEGAVVVATADGRIATREQIDWTTVLSERTGQPPASTVFLGVAQRGRRLEFFDFHGRPRTVVLPPGAELQDAASLRALYTVNGRAKLLDLQTGRTRDLGRVAHARLEILSAITAFGRTVRAFRVG